MLDITTIILTYNEERHIRRCLENVCSFSKHVIVIDSPSSDSTVDICKEFDNVSVVVHPYPGNQAEQLNWALDHVNITTEWVLRIDADEYLSDNLIDEINKKLPVLGSNFTGVFLRRNHFFMGKRMKYERAAVILRLFRNGKAHCEKRLMDEYMMIEEGETTMFNNLFFDHNLSPLTDYCRKHINYAAREAAMLLDEEFKLSDNYNSTDYCIGKNVKSIRRAKSRYTKLPKFWRGTAYFLYRYFLTGTFLQGKAGFVYCFMQAWWYRTLVDGILSDVQRTCGKDVELIKDYLLKNYNIAL